MHIIIHVCQVGSLIPRPVRRFRLHATKSWAGPGNEAIREGAPLYLKATITVQHLAIERYLQLGVMQSVTKIAVVGLVDQDICLRKGF